MNAKRRKLYGKSRGRNSYVPSSATGSTSQPLSSSASRFTASSSVSPSSQGPAGWLSLSTPSLRSSTSRNLPSRSPIAAAPRLAVFPVARGLVELEHSFDAYLDQQELAVARDDRRRDDVGVAAHASL